MFDRKRNLLEETISVLARNGKEPKDVIWVGSEDGWFTWEDFCQVADTEYDSGFGGAEVARDLVIVGQDFWLERGEYDGSEWWECKTWPAQPKERKPVDALTTGQADAKGRDYENDLASIAGWKTEDG